MQLASATQRFINSFIDSCIALVVTVPLSFFGISNPLLSISYVIILLIYYLVFEQKYGRTIGKMVTNTIVVDNQYKKPSFVQIVGRTLCRLIPFDVLSFISADPIGWHDSLAKTAVIQGNLRIEEKQK